MAGDLLRNPLGSLRAALRLAAAVTACAVLYPVLLAGKAILAGAPEHRARWRACALRLWCRILLAIFGARVVEQGSPPEPPFLMVANHLSYMDILVLASRLDAVFVAKAEIASWPVLGPICRSMDTLFLNRARTREIPEILERIEALQRNRQGVIFFPEGSTSDGSSVVPFRPSLLAVAARSGRPVSWACLSYRTPAGCEPAGRRVHWFGGAGFIGHLVRLAALPGFEARLTLGERRFRNSDRKALADELWKAVLAAYPPTKTGEPDTPGDRAC